MHSGPLHFIGIGGVGMCAVAEACVGCGYGVAGSDRCLDTGQALESLEKLAARQVTLYPQDGSGIHPGLSAVVTSTAIEADNPDLLAARALGLRIMHRSEMLAELTARGRCLAITGTAGKSTVTAMVGWILAQTGRAPNVVNGAPIVNWCSAEATGSSFVGGGEWWVIEADESDRSLLNLSPDAVVVTNVSTDHFSAAEALQLFRDFSARATEFTLWQAGEAWRHEPAHLIEHTAAGTRFTLDGIEVVVPCPGIHNAINAVDALRACEQLGVSLADAAAALKKFAGVARRLQVVGRHEGLSVVDDYAHNPEKIRASWAALAAHHDQLVVIWRPHGFGPLRNMLDALAQAFAEVLRQDDRLLLLPVYDAGGTAARSIDSAALRERMLQLGVSEKAVVLSASLDAAAESAPTQLRAEASHAAIVVMGARDPGLPELARRLAQSRIA